MWLRHGPLYHHSEQQLLLTFDPALPIVSLSLFLSVCVSLSLGGRCAWVPVMAVAFPSFRRILTFQQVDFLSRHHHFLSNLWWRLNKTLCGLQPNAAFYPAVRCCLCRLSTNWQQQEVKPSCCHDGEYYVAVILTITRDSIYF